MAPLTRGRKRQITTTKETTTTSPQTRGGRGGTPTKETTTTSNENPDEEEQLSDEESYLPAREIVLADCHKEIEESKEKSKRGLESLITFLKKMGMPAAAEQTFEQAICQLLEGSLDRAKKDLISKRINNDNDYGNFMDEEEEPLEKKLDTTFKDRKIDELELYDNYKTPADDDKQSQDLSGSDAVLNMQRNMRMVMKKNVIEVVLEESSDELEAWDCETIVSTYSNLDNHPGRIGAPETARKKLSETIFESLKRNNNNNIISLHWKEKLPLDFLTHGKSAPKEKVAIKKEKREARMILKKETKELYRDEAKRAQKAVSVSGPSSIRLM